MGFDDLEYGPVGEKYLRIKEMVKRHARKGRRFVIAAVMLTIGIMVKLTYDRIDSVMETTATITLDESSYVPFTIRDDIIVDTEATAVREAFPIKSSPANVRLQLANLAMLEARIRKFLQGTEHICIHASHLGVPFDITVFKNGTLVNPEILEVSKEYALVGEADLADKIKWVKRPKWIRVSFLDSQLIRVPDHLLVGHQAICFSHYNMV